MKDEVRMTVRIPTDVADFLTEVAGGNFTSRNAEIVRSVRERMGTFNAPSLEQAATTGEKFGDRTPAVAGNSAALTSGASSTVE